MERGAVPMSENRGVHIKVAWSYDFQDEGATAPPTDQWIPEDIYREGTVDEADVVSEWLTDQTDWLVEDWVLAYPDMQTHYEGCSEFHAHN